MEESKIGPKVLLIGGSAGSLDVLLQVLPRVENIPCALVIILHRKNAEDRMLEDLIAMKTSASVCEVEDKTMLTRGCIYIAPSDYHLLFENDYVISLDASEKVNYSRPSIDVAFESAAEAYGNNVTGLLLSGANDDGTQGLIAIKKAGGITAVQDPASADMPFMPQHAIRHAKPDAIVTVDGMVALFGRAEETGGLLQ